MWKPYYVPISYWSHFAPFHYSQGLEQLEVRLPKKKKKKRTSISNSLPLDEEN